MFNSIIKNKFLNDVVKHEASKMRFLSLFKATERVETILNKDLYELNEEEMQAVVNELMGIRSRSNVSTVGYIKKYINWCYIQDLFNVQDSINKIVIDGTIGIKAKLVKSPLHLHVCLNRVFEEEEENTIDILYRCFFWMAYAGICERDIFQVKTKDVDLLNRIITYNGVDYPIYNEGFKAFKKCVELNYFNKKHPRYKNPLKRYRVESGVLLRGCGGKDNLANIERIISFKCNQKNDKSNNQLTFKRVRVSGIYYRAYLKEQIGEKVDFGMEVDADLQLRQLRLQPGEILKNDTITSKAYDYRRDYELWKKII